MAAAGFGEAAAGFARHFEQVIRDNVEARPKLSQRLEWSCQRGMEALETSFLQNLLLTYVADASQLGRSSLNFIHEHRHSDSIYS